MVPYINQEGALEIPYLENIEATCSNSNTSAIQSTFSRKESINNSIVVKAQSSNVYANGRGNSSGRSMIP